MGSKLNGQRDHTSFLPEEFADCGAGEGEGVSVEAQQAPESDLQVSPRKPRGVCGLQR